MRRFATVLPALIAAALLAPSAASARVVLVATGDGAATLTDVATNQVVGRIPVGGRSRAVAAAPDGSRGYVAAGRRGLGIDLSTRPPGGAAAIAGTQSTLAVSADGRRLYAARRAALDVIDPATFAVLGSVRLPRTSNPTSLAVSSDGTRAAVVIDRRHVAIVSLERGTILKRVEINAPAAVAYPPDGRDVWVSSPARSGGRPVRLRPPGQVPARPPPGPGGRGGGPPLF